MLAPLQTLLVPMLAPQPTVDNELASPQLLLAPVYVMLAPFQPLLAPVQSMLASQPLAPGQLC